jgi:hypothetical protein
MSTRGAAMIDGVDGARAIAAIRTYSGGWNQASQGDAEPVPRFRGLRSTVKLGSRRGWNEPGRCRVPILRDCWASASGMRGG